MSRIDWSKAPEGATHYDNRPGRMPAFMRMHDDSDDVWQHWNGSEWARYGDIPDWGLMAKRPSEWDGQGLPPVGVMVHIVNDDGLMYGHGESGEVIAHVENTAVVRMSYGLGCFTAKHLRTQEQVAEGMRIAEINEMIRHVRDYPGGRHGVSHIAQLRIHEEVCMDLHAAGYRKQVAP